MKSYSKGELTVNWDLKKCIHSEKCRKGLPKVFDPNARPWINLEAASNEQIAAQVRECPSGALSLNNETKNTLEPMKLTVTEDGPILIKGDCTVTLANGEEKTSSGVTALCRCGASTNKPFCDGSHKKVDFKG